MCVNEVLILSINFGFFLLKSFDRIIFFSELNFLGTVFNPTASRRNLIRRFESSKGTVG